MNIKAFLSIEENVNQEMEFIEKARFLANRIFNDYFSFEEQKETISMHYDALKSMFDIMFDYIVFADNKGKDLRAIISQAFEEREKAA